MTMILVCKLIHLYMSVYCLTIIGSVGNTFWRDFHDRLVTLGSNVPIQLPPSALPCCSMEQVITSLNSTFLWPQTDYMKKLHTFSVRVMPSRTH